MGKITKIQWCDSTANPIQGCGGCELWRENNHTCYAGQLTERFGNSNSGLATEFLTPELKSGAMAKAAKYRELTGTNRKAIVSNGKVKAGAKPWLNGLPRIIFVSDMGDALTEGGFAPFEGEPVTDEVLFNFLKEEILDVVRSENGLRHEWLWLTKRPNRLHQFAAAVMQEDEEWPQNLWVGTSVTTRASVSRVRQLCSFGNERVTKFVSVEPLWEEVSLERHLDDLHWVIIGGESGRRSQSRAFDCDWVRKLIDECDRANVPVFVKQLGGNPIEGGTHLRFRNSSGGDSEEWPANLRIRQMPVARIH